MRPHLATLLAFTATLAGSAPAENPDPTLRAGAAIQDVTPPFDSLLINGGFTERRRGKMNPGDLNARCFVLQRGDTTIALAVVDSCMIPRTVCDRAKALASEATGIPHDRILISATHTHSAPSTMDYCLGTMADPAYTAWLPPKIAAGITAAFKNLEPARVAWNQVSAKGFTHCRRWITRPDRMQQDPFGQTTVRAMMHPGYQNPAYIGPAGPADDQLSILSVEAVDGRPLAVLANFSMHYKGGGGPADYFGTFADRLASKLQSDGHTPVCAMSQGTSGDLHWMDYSNPDRGSDASRYTDGLVEIATGALSGLEHHHDAPLDMHQQSITLPRRLPDADRLAWADKLLTTMGDRRPRNRPEVYAEQARFIHDNPAETLVLQAARIGDLAFTAIPNEVYGITGLELKARSPFPHTFNIELANGAAGYIPPRAQHALGGYTTWPARTAGLTEHAERAVVSTLLDMLGTLAGKPASDPPQYPTPYAAYILTKQPLAYHRCNEFHGPHLADASGHDRQGKIDGPVAYHLPGPGHTSFSQDGANPSLQLVGGTVSTDVPGARALTLSFWNGLAPDARPNTGDLVSLGDALRLHIGGTGTPDNARGHLVLTTPSGTTTGRTPLALRTWHHLVLSFADNHLAIHLDGNSAPEIRAPFPIATPTTTTWKLGGSLPLEGRLDEIAWFGQPLSGQDTTQLYAASGLTPPPPPPPPPTTYQRGPTDAYATAVTASQPLAHWPHQHDGRQRADIPGVGDTYTATLWFRNRLPVTSRPVTAYLFSRGPDGDREAPGDHLGIGGTHSAAGNLIVYNGNRAGTLLAGSTKLQPDSWHHVALVRDGDRIRVYLDGNPEPEIDGQLPRTYPDAHPQFFLGGRSDNFANLQGDLDHAALHDRALAPDDILTLFKTVTHTPSQPVTPPSPPEPPRPLPLAESVSSIRVPDGFEIELVAAEPLVQDPVAIDWGADGKLWVAEMADYPSGIDGKPGGRVRFLEDTDGDGTYDNSTLFLDGLNFPAGIIAWRDGVLVAAAPDILYAADTDGDGTADSRTVLFTGFKQGNQQLRVNGLHWGLDNLVHGANGSHHSNYAAGIAITHPPSGRQVELGGLDFRFQPDTGLLEPLTGPSQFGRTRDDWGNAFGVQNSHPLWHVVLEHRYLSRHPGFAPPDPRRQLRPSNAQVFPSKSPQKRYHSFNQSGRFTSACGPTIYRDHLLFADGRTHAFTCEPFHNLVQHVVLQPDGPTFTATRAEPGDTPDFFTSTDRWCRPVMVRTGPDGALWVVDMVRYMIEHIDWLPEDGKNEMRAHQRHGENLGRLYRIIPTGKKPRPVPRLDATPTAALTAHLASPNGPVRDLAHRLLIERADPAAATPLTTIARAHTSPQARLHALRTLDGLGQLPPDLLQAALADPHPQLRRHALQLAEQHADNHPELLAAAIALAGDPNPAVRLQAACSLGNTDHPDAGHALAQLAARDDATPYLRAAVLSSSTHHFETLATAALQHGHLLDELLKLGGQENRPTLDRLLKRLTSPPKNGYQPSTFHTLATWLDHHPGDAAKLATAIAAARTTVTDQAADPTLRAAATALLGRDPAHAADDQQTLATLLTPSVPDTVRHAATTAIARSGDDSLPARLLPAWPSYLPADRTRIIDTLLQRKPWTRSLLTAIADGTILRNDLDTSRRQRLLNHEDDALRQLAASALQADTSSSRQAQLDAFRPALELRADPTRGRTVFDNLCAVCHLPPAGGPINGPDLRSITDRTRSGLFSSILDPNFAIDPAYAAYTLTATDGTTLFGRVLAESPNHLTLRLLDGTDRQLPRTTIKSLTNTGRSLMPEGLEAAMTHQDLADLIAFLQSFGQAR